MKDNVCNPLRGSGKNIGNGIPVSYEFLVFGNHMRSRNDSYEIKGILNV